MNSFTPLPQLKMQLRRRLEQCLRLAEEHFKRSFKAPEISFELRGVKAGVAHLQENLLRFNPILLQENAEEFLYQVVPHELAHLLVYQLFGRVKPHGREWQGMMQGVFGLPAETCHRFDVASVQGDTFGYRCACQQHLLSKRRHLRILREKTDYICRKCRTKLIFTDEN